MAELNLWGTKAYIEVDGRPLPDSVERLLLEVVVDDSTHLPDLFEIRLRDDHQDVLGRAGLRLGAKVSISARKTGREESTELLTAEVAVIEGDHGARGTHYLVRGYDLSWRLGQERKTVGWGNVKDSDVAQRIALAGGLQAGRIDATSVVHEHLAQVDLTDWEFLQLRARASGRECVIAKGKLDFRTPRPATGAPSRKASAVAPTRHQLAIGTNLVQFRPRLSATGQVAQVEVRGWDPRTKAAVVGRASASSTSVVAAEPPGRAAQLAGSRTHVAVDRGVTTQAEATAAASALAEVMGSSHVEARGIALGDPTLVAGTAVSITGVGSLFDGKYVLTTTRHVYDPQGYRTHFEISGRNERSLLGLLSGGGGSRGGSASAGGRAAPGVAMAIVTNVATGDDRATAGQVKVKMPWLSETYESHWARVVQLGAGDARGSLWLPEVGDEVLVAFEQGDVRRPVVVGGLHNGKDAAPVGGKVFQSGKVQQRGFFSRRNHQLVFDDSETRPGVVVQSGSGKLVVTLDDKKTVITVSSSGDVEISGGGTVTVKGTGGVKVTSDAGIALEAKGKLELKGTAGVAIDGGPQVDVKGAMVGIGGGTVKLG